MLTQNQIKTMVVDKLVRGILPRAMPERVWGGPSHGTTCAACDRPIAKDQSEIEAECADGTIRRYHVLCFSVVTTERDSRLERATGDTSAVT